MRNFSTPLDERGVRSMVVQQEPITAVGVEVEVTVAQVASPRAPEIRSATFVMSEDADWDWRALRDYVCAQIEEMHGPFPRDDRKEYGIFNAFVDRWGDRSARIARYAFETADGMWMGAPISINRFCKNSDPYFGTPISEKLVDEFTAPW